jgi:hypothetical protein
MLFVAQVIVKLHAPLSVEGRDTPPPTHYIKFFAIDAADAAKAVQQIQVTLDSRADDPTATDDIVEIEVKPQPEEEWNPEMRERFPAHRQPGVWFESAFVYYHDGPQPPARWWQFWRRFRRS